MRGLGAFALVMVLASCGSSGAGSGEPSKAAELVGLRETCAQLEAGMPRAGSGASVSAWMAYADRLDELEAAGDTESDNTIALLRPAVAAFVADPQGMDWVDAREKLYAALDTIMRRCTTVGSSAFQ